MMASTRRGEARGSARQTRPHPPTARAHAIKTRGWALEAQRRHDRVKAEDFGWVCAIKRGLYRSGKAFPPSLRDCFSVFGSFLPLELELDENALVSNNSIPISNQNNNNTVCLLPYIYAWIYFNHFISHTKEKAAEVRFVMSVENWAALLLIRVWDKLNSCMFCQVLYIYIYIFNFARWFRQ